MEFLLGVIEVICGVGWVNNSEGASGSVSVSFVNAVPNNFSENDWKYVFCCDMLLGSSKGAKTWGTCVSWVL